MVVGVDAAVSNDCVAISVVSWHEDRDIPMILEVHIFDAPKVGKFDYATVIDDPLDEIRAMYRVVSVVYDEYQLHDNMTSRAKADAWKAIPFAPFDQKGDRLKADTRLRKLIRFGQLMHNHNKKMEEHVRNADAKLSNEDKKIRIVKRKSSSKVDGLVATSMAVQEATEELKDQLNITHTGPVKVRFT